MTGALAWLAGFLLLPAAGAPLLLRPAFRRFAMAPRVVLCGAAGAVFVSFAMTLASLFGLRWLPLPILAAAALMAGATSALLPGTSSDAAAAERAAGAAGAAAGAISALAVSAALAATLIGAATSIDLYFFWGPKAQQFAIARGIDTAYLAEPAHAYMHAYYPPLVANLGALASIVSGGFSWTAATLTFPILLAALALSLPGVLRGAASAPAAAAASALAVSAAAVVGIQANVAGNGDPPLVVFELLAAALLMRRDAADPPVELLAGILLAGASAAKVEGLTFALAALALFVAARKGGLAARALSAARLGLPTLLTLAAWFGYGWSRRLFSEYSEYGRFVDLHFENLSRIPGALAGALAATQGALPYLVPLIGLLAARRPLRAMRLPVGIAALLVLFFVFTYLHLPTDPSEWISWSAPRLLLPAAMLLAIAPCAADPAPASP